MSRNHRAWLLAPSGQGRDLCSWIHGACGILGWAPGAWYMYFGIKAIRFEFSPSVLTLSTLRVTLTGEEETDYGRV